MKHCIIAAVAALSCMHISLAAEKTPAKESTECPEMQELTKKIDSLLEKAPKGKHGGKLISDELMNLMNERRGGLITPKTNGRTFLLVDARGVKDDFVSGFRKELGKKLFVGCTAIEKAIPDEADPFVFANNCKTAMSPAVVMLIDRSGAPVLSAYPEEAVGVLNVAKIKDKDKGVYFDRLAKEVWRTIGMALGGYCGTAPNGKLIGGVLSPVFSINDLDGIKAKTLSVFQINAVNASVEKIGIQAAKPVPYGVACQQGWAPAPTNAIQRAIWDKMIMWQSLG